MEKSKRFSLNKTELKSVAMGAGIAMASALVTYLLQMLPNVDFGEYTPMVVAIAGILLNTARKWLEGKK